ncbi:vitamin K-dependent protein Z-like [Pristis pectinata]|uniref:vitamin K-dependent protein Z-like n=1 Tax=Pristis pectinata TaxID=685728 RepID=UPI00223E1D0E|nr:vitamin K-dependent protein Z-like [Pristis pectinata]
MNEILKNRKIILLFLCSQVNCLFLQKPLANNFLSRVRRSNVGLEELVDNNLQRECFEETCSKEEARECFTDEGQTEQFWKQYNGSSQEVDALQEYTAPGKQGPMTTLPPNTSVEGHGLREHTQDLERFSLEYPWNNCDLPSILTFLRELTEKQKKMRESHQKLIELTKDMIHLATTSLNSLENNLSH